MKEIKVGDFVEFWNGSQGVITEVKGFCVILDSSYSGECYHWKNIRRVNGISVDE